MTIEKCTAGGLPCGIGEQGDRVAGNIVGGYAHTDQTRESMAEADVGTDKAGMEGVNRDARCLGMAVVLT